MSFTHYYKDAGSPTPGLIIVAGSFRSDGANAVKSGSVKGKGFSVAGTVTDGLWTVTFDQVGYEFIGATYGVRAEDGESWTVQGGDYSASAKTLQIRAFEQATATHALADMADDADAEITFCAIFKNTSI